MHVWIYRHFPSRDANLHLLMGMPVGIIYLGLWSWRVLPHGNGDGGKSSPDDPLDILDYHSILFFYALWDIYQ